MTEAIKMRIAGEELLALASKVLYWPRCKTLFVADLHLGKAAAFRAKSLPVPHGTTDATLARLSSAVKGLDCGQVVILGDLWHNKAGRTEEIEGKLVAWRKSATCGECFLVTGNHDAKSGELDPSTGIHQVDEVFLDPFVCRHHPVASDSGYVLCGHLHPAATLAGWARQSLRLPCFWFGEQTGVLPAFGEFTGMADIRARSTDLVLAVCEERIWSVGG